MDYNFKMEKVFIGFGKDYISLAEDIFSKTKEMRMGLISTMEYEIPRIHIMDHDTSEEIENIRLENNEYVIRIYGVEVARRIFDNVDDHEMIADLKSAITNNIEVLQ